MIGVEGRSKLGEASGGHDEVKGRLIGSPFLLSGLVQALGVRLGLGMVHGRARVSAGLKKSRTRFLARTINKEDSSVFGDGSCPHPFYFHLHTFNHRLLLEHFSGVCLQRRVSRSA